MPQCSVSLVPSHPAQTTMNVFAPHGAFYAHPPCMAADQPHPYHPYNHATTAPPCPGCPPTAASPCPRCPPPVAPLCSRRPHAPTTSPRYPKCPAAHDHVHPPEQTHQPVTYTCPCHHGTPLAV